MSSWRDHRILMGIILAIHAALLIRLGYVTSPVYDEPAHLAAGINDWSTRSFDLYRVNPPLVRMTAAIPVLLSGASYPVSIETDDPFARPEFPAGERFLRAHGKNAFWYFSLARWACIPFSLLGGYICFRWSKELHGLPSGFIALLLWCFCPNILAWGATITADVGAAALGASAAYSYWKWLQAPHWRSSLVAGTVLGLAEIAKMTWLCLFALWPIIWIVQQLAVKPTVARGDPRSEIKQLGFILFVAIFLINVCYGFDGSFRRLATYGFISQALAGDKAGRASDNRFRGTLFGPLPIPLPEDYVCGIDVQKHDFEAVHWSYLRGVQKTTGWYYYYVYAMLVKIPLGTLGLIGAACGATLISARYRSCWRDELMVLTPALAVLILVSSQTGMNRYMRYVLPIFPFLYISASRVGIAFLCQHRTIKILTASTLAASITSSLQAFPHAMSYFHELAGGCRGGHNHLVDSNIDWGQDLLHLKRWLARHPEARPLHLRYFGVVDPALAEIDTLPVPPGPDSSDPRADPKTRGPQPGWFAVSVNELRGYRHYLLSRPTYTYFLDLQPAGSAGYSIYVYHISDEQADNLRRNHGLPAFDSSTRASEHGAASAESTAPSGTGTTSP